MLRRFVVCLALALCSAPVFAQGDLFFSEYIEGSSNNKALEIFNPTSADVSLSGYRIQIFFNGSGSAGTTINLTGTITAGGFYVVADDSAGAAILAVADQVSTSNFFNGDDAIVLHRDGVAIDVIGQVGFDPGSQWGTGLVSTQDNTLRRKAGITAGDTIATDGFDPAAEWDGFPQDTFDGLNGGEPPPPPPVSVREIFDIQGSGDASPFTNDTVETRDNIVTAVGVNGFFIQTPDFRADASTATSNGMFVFTGSVPTVEAGDQVDVKGRVVEFHDMTEFSGSVEVTVDAHDQPVPAHFDIPDGYTNFEPLEGMLVRVVDGVAGDGTDRFGDTIVRATGSRPFRTPGLTGGDYPDLFDIKVTGLGAPAQPIIGGAHIELAEGPLMFEFDDYSLWPTVLDFTNPEYPRRPRAANAGEMVIAAQNLLRLFDTINDPDIDDESPEPEEYAARIAAASQHILENLGAPDVVAVSEVENLGVLQDLAGKLAFDDADAVYTAYLLEGHDIGGIDVGFLVRDTVRVDSVEQLSPDVIWDDPNARPDEIPYLNDRPPLLLRGAYVANGTPFPIAVIAVHQRSLSGVHTERTQTKRRLQAEDLAGHIGSLLAAEPGLRLAITGDFNAFQFDDGFVDSMGIITAAGVTNQVLSVPAEDRYSFIFNGVAQVLDHTLTSPGLDSWIRDFMFAHANADAPASFAPLTDHDGPVLFVMTDNDGDGVPDDVDDCATGDARPTVIIGGCDSGVPNVSFEGGCTLADRINAIRESARNHGQAASETAALLNSLVKDGVITGQQKGAIQSCVAGN